MVSTTDKSRSIIFQMNNLIDKRDVKIILLW